MEIRLKEGEQPVSGFIIYLKKSNGSGYASVIEWHETDGQWVCPHTTGGYFYTAISPEDLERRMKSNGFL